jgi:hypothetical protein
LANPANLSQNPAGLLLIWQAYPDTVFPTHIKNLQSSEPIQALDDVQHLIYLFISACSM